MKKVNMQVLNKVRQMLDSMKPKDTQTRYIKRIYEHIISIHLDRPQLFNKSSRAKYSEADYTIKFWGVIFESFFHSNDYMLHWGDTISSPCKSKKLKFKADLRIVVMSEGEAAVDGATTEIAKTASPKKLFNDKLKAVLGTKCHLNNFLGSIPYIPGKDIKNLVVPVIQIMAFDVHVYTLHLANRGLYILQDYGTFSFPTAYSSLKTGLADLVNGLSKIESLLADLKSYYEACQVPIVDNMERVLGRVSRPKRTQISQ